MPNSSSLEQPGSPEHVHAGGAALVIGTALPYAELIGKIVQHAEE
jgi:hypothetical protein